LQPGVAGTSIFDPAESSSRMTSTCPSSAARWIGHAPWSALTSTFMRVAISTAPHRNTQHQHFATRRSVHGARLGQRHAVQHTQHTGATASREQFQTFDYGEVPVRSRQMERSVPVPHGVAFRLKSDLWVINGHHACSSVRAAGGRGRRKESVGDTRHCSNPARSGQLHSSAPSARSTRPQFRRRSTA